MVAGPGVAAPGLSMVAGPAVEEPEQGPRRLAGRTAPG
jgi:hypothetical protein